jgi:hypothetical protein
LAGWDIDPRPGQNTVFIPCKDVALMVEFWRRAGGFVMRALCATMVIDTSSPSYRNYLDRDAAHTFRADRDDHG